MGLFMNSTPRFLLFEFDSGAAGRAGGDLTARSRALASSIAKSTNSGLNHRVSAPIRTRSGDDH